MRKAEMELKKGQNLIEHEKEIYSRPARTWFQSEKEKLKSQSLFYISHVSVGESHTMLQLLVENSTSWVPT